MQKKRMICAVAVLLIVAMLVSVNLSASADYSWEWTTDDTLLSEPDLTPEYDSDWWTTEYETYPPTYYDPYPTTEYDSEWWVTDDEPTTSSTEWWMTEYEPYPTTEYDSEWWVTDDETTTSPTEWWMTEYEPDPTTKAPETTATEEVFSGSDDAKGDAYFTIDMPEQVTVGGSFDVTISVDGSVGTYGFTDGVVNIAYDPDGIRVDSYTVFPDFKKSTVLIGGEPMELWNGSYYAVADDAANQKPGYMGMGMLTLLDSCPLKSIKCITLHCSALSEGSSMITAWASSWHSIAVPSSGTATVQIRSVPVEPTAEPSSAETGKKGDVNLDGEITATDARITLRTAASLEVLSYDEFQRADYDGNGAISATDARCILRVAAKLDPSGSSGSGTAPTKPNVVPTTGAPVTKPVTPKSDYDRLVQYLKANGTYDDGEYVLKKANTYKDMYFVATINYDVQESRIEFYSHGFDEDGNGCSVALYFNPDSVLQNVVFMYVSPYASPYYGNGQINKQTYSESNNHINWSSLDGPSYLADELKAVGETQLDILFVEASIILQATGTGITWNSLGFTAY